MATAIERRLLLLIWLTAVSLVAATGTVRAHPGHGGSAEPVSVLVRLQLIGAKLATVHYNDVRNAERAGYRATPTCVSSPAGGMGIHYVNPRLQQAPPDPYRPAILVYEPQQDGGRRLVALEYFQLAEGAGARPSLFGQPFDGPMTAPGMPAFYALHAWVWRHNPAGMFAAFNPDVSCRTGD